MGAGFGRDANCNGKITSGKLSERFWAGWRNFRGGGAGERIVGGNVPTIMQDYVVTCCGYNL